MLYVAGYYFVMGAALTTGVLIVAIAGEYLLKKFGKDNKEED